MDTFCIVNDIDVVLRGERSYTSSPQRRISKVDLYRSGKLRMNARETEENFCAIIIAIQNGKITIARRVFDFCVNNAANDKLDRAINLLRNNGNINLSRELDRLKTETS